MLYVNGVFNDFFIDSANRDHERDRRHRRKRRHAEISPVVYDRQSRSGDSKDFSMSVDSVFNTSISF